LREQCLAGTGRADHQQAMFAGRGNLECALGSILSANFGEIRRRSRSICLRSSFSECGGRHDTKRPVTFQGGDHFGQMIGQPKSRAADETRLEGVRGRQNHFAAAFCTGNQCGQQLSRFAKRASQR